MKRRWRVALALGLVTLIGVPIAAHAQPQDQQNLVKVVPFSQTNPALPHPGHEGARVTLKAVIQNANCNQNPGYRIWWDVNRNGNYDDDWAFNMNRDGAVNGVRDIGRTIELPNVDRDSKYNINVRVRNNCDNNPATRDKFATYRLFIYDFRPSADPRNWPDEQFEIMTQIAVQESMWYLHRTMSSRSRTDTGMWGMDNYHYATGMSMWVMTINGHMPAYPPWHINQFPNGGNDLPDGWVEANNERWDNDPYAETVLRYANFLARNGHPQGIAGGEEQNTCGFDRNRREIPCERRIPGTADNRGAYAGSNSGVYANGLFLGGIATLLPALGGTPIRADAGGVRNQSWEWYVQQMVDKIGYQQIDGSCGKGGWYYNDFNGNGGCGHSDGSTTQWAYIGLESAEIGGAPFDVIVNNRHKYRIAYNLVRNQRNDLGAGYRSNSGRGDIKLTGGALVASRWLNINHMNRADGVDPFPGYNGYSAGRLRQAYDGYVSFLSGRWTSGHRVGSHWQDALWEPSGARNYLCNNTNRLYNDNNDNAMRCGSSYAMYSNQKGFRTGTGRIGGAIFGADNRPANIRGPDDAGQIIGSHNWVREFNTYYLRAMNRGYNAGNPRDAHYGRFGDVRDAYCRNHSVTCSYGSGRLASPMGGLVLTPTVFTPKPVAIGTVAPPQVAEGCAGGNNGRVVFDHSESFHPSDTGRIVAYQWDVDASDELWWDTDGDPDFVTPGDDGQVADTFAYTYPRQGNYTATLRVIDNLGLSKTTTVVVRVQAAENVPPAAAHGGPYVIEVGQALELEGSVTDGNANCGQELTIGWDLNNDNGFNDAEAGNAAATVPWAQLDDLPVGQPNRIRLRVVDEAGEVDIAETTLTIYPQEPVADGRANPNPAACRVAVTFDGNASFHPNPQRTIAQYDWNTDGREGFEGSGPLFNYAYDRFGEYQVTLRVTDDLGRTDETQFQVVVSEGNQAPTARVARNQIEVLEGDPLVLDGRASTDPDTNCGDRIVRYEWDINADGDFGDDADVQGANPTVAWADLLGAGLRVVDPETNRPRYTMRLRVTDDFGETSTAEFEVVLREAAPDVEVVQRPDPAVVSRRNGAVTVSLDGRESQSPIDGVTIVDYAWDLDLDGEYDDGRNADGEGLPVVQFTRVVPENQRAPGQLPEYCVSLRVTDSNGRVGTLAEPYCVNITVPPTPPTADADPSDPPERAYHILLGDGVTLDGSQSFDPDDDDFIEFYRWDLTYDEEDGFQANVTERDADGNRVEARVQLTAEQLAEFGVDDVGEFPVRLQVEDNFQQTNTDDTTLTVYPRNPTAVAVANPNPAACQARVTFDGSQSEHPHPQVDVIAYRWDFDGDGQYDDAVGEVVTHRFAQFTFDGPIQVGLQVEDGNENTGQTTVPVRVDQGNRAPVPVAGGFRDGDGRVVGPYAIAVGDSLELSAAGSNEPDAECGDRITGYAWHLNDDNNPDAVGEEPELTWAQLQALGIDEPGNYDVRLVVTDRFGVTAVNVVTLRVVNGPEAVATANPNRTGCGNDVTFSGERSTTDGPENQGFALVEYEWDLDGDGVYDDAEGPRVTRAAVGLPDDDGNIVVRAGLRVTDASGRTDVTTVQVVIDVQNLPPVANAGGPYVTGPIGNSWAPVRLDGRTSSDPNAPCDQIVTYKWDTDGDGRFGDDDNPADLTGAVVPDYVNNGWRVNTVQTVALIVCDAEGACSDPADAEVEVLDEAPPSGQIVSPRAGGDLCIGEDNFQVEVSVSDPEGDLVEVIIRIAGEVVGSQDVNTPDDGTPATVRINIDPAQVPEGLQLIQAVLRDNNGAESVADSGGRIPFDRTDPVVTIGDQLGDGVCYNPGRVPNPEVAVDDRDPNIEVNEETLEEGCGRTLRVSATDSCGNTGTAVRPYLLAVPVEVEIGGADEGELVADARMSWDIVGPAECASRTSATLSLNNGQPRGYGENELINQPGAYTLSVAVANCQGVARNQLRSFLVNAPPVAVPVPADRVDPDNALTYVVDEGSGLQVDASESLPPEEVDRIVEYAWDWFGGGADANGAVAPFPTDRDGRFQPTLTVTDTLGATHTQQFTVIVNDVDPIPDAGGPYVTPQGVAVEFDARRSRPGSPDDPISEYRWDFGDGSPVVAGADETQPQHTYERNGDYVATLTVCDEDNCEEVEVRVEVRDVDPTVGELSQPDELYEIRPMRFSIEAEAGSPADPITRYEWDIDGDGQPEYAGADVDSITHQFREAGTYNMTVTVYDGDSETVEVVQVQVDEITLDQLLEYIGEQLQAVAPAVQATRNQALQRSVATAFDAVADGRWGERHDRRGTTLLALDKVVTGLVDLQAAGFDFGLELWAVSRQMIREMTRMRARLLEAEDQLPHPEAIARASQYITEMEEMYGEDPESRDDFEAAITGQQPFLVSDLMADAQEAYYWLADAEDPCNQYDGFPISTQGGLQAASIRANETNQQLVRALRALKDDMEAYVAAGAGEGDTGPGRDIVDDAIDSLDSILGLAGLSVYFECPPGELCVSDIEALRLEVWAMDVAEALISAQSAGAWSRNWQNCLVLAVKFRIELSILRVASVCGPNVAITQRARQVQGVGLALVEQGRNAAALEYYIADERRCFMVEVLNECLAPSIGPNGEPGDETPPVLYPDECPQAGEDGEGQIEGAVDMFRWRPPPPPEAEQN